MKKLLKIIGVLLAIFVILFIVLAIWGMNDSKKEEELAKSNINNKISFEGNFSDLDTSNDLTGKHIVISGKINDVGSLYCTLINNDFVIKAYCDNISEDVIKDGIISIDGVCTYHSANKIRMRNCQIVDYKKPDTPTKKEENSVVSVEKETSTEKDENFVVPKETKSEQGTVKIDSTNDNLDDIKKFLVDALGKSTVKSVELTRNDTIIIRVYFERKSILFSTDKLKMSVLNTAYETLKVYNNYINSNDNAPENVDVIACFPNDGKDNADKDCYQVVCRRLDLEKFDFTSSYNSQMEDYAYISKWFISIR